MLSLCGWAFCAQIQEKWRDRPAGPESCQLQAPTARAWGSGSTRVHTGEVWTQAWASCTTCYPARPRGWGH